MNEETKLKNVVAYLRVSTDAQADDGKFGLDVQRQMIQDYCLKHDMRVDHEVVDEGESGAKERQKFMDIITTEHNPPIAGVVVAKSDRVARDINIYFYYKMLLKKADMELWSVTEDFGQAGLFAPILEAFTLCVADMERHNITMRTSGGRVAKSNLGGYSGGHAPYGYEVHNKRLVVNPEQAEVVREIFDLRSKGGTYKGIAAKLNEEGKKSRSGKPFSFSTVRIILDNKKTYEGYYHYKGLEDGKKWVKGQQEPILKEDKESD